MRRTLRVRARIASRCPAEHALKLIADRDQLAAAVGRAVQGLPQNPVIPVRAGMLLRTSDDHVHLTCGDEDVTFIARCPAEISEEGFCILPGRMAAELTRYLPAGDVLISTENGKVTVACGRSQFTLSTKPGGDYPLWESPPGPLCTLDGAVLAAGLHKVAPAASDDLPLLSGIMLSLSETGLTLVATDKYKLGTVELPIAAEYETGTKAGMPLLETRTNEQTAFLSSRVAERFARACEGSATVGWDDKLVSLHSQGLLVVARQVAGQMPAGWREYVRQGDRWYPCETAELTRAVKMAFAAGESEAGTQDKRVELAFSDGEITITAGGARQVIEFSYDGREVTLAVGGRNLLAGLAGCGEQVRLSFTVPRRPLLLDSEGLRWLVQTRSENNYSGNGN